MKSLESLPKENNGNNQNQDELSSNINLDNLNDEQLIDLAIKKSLEQENLEIEKDKEEQLIQLAILNSIQEINGKKEEKEEKENNDENQY